MSDVVPGMAEAIETRRRELRLSPGAFADAAGLTRQGVGNVRAGKRRNYAADTIYGVADALRWEPDWYDRLARGEVPLPLPVSTETDWVAVLLEEVRAMRRELRALHPPTDGSAPDGEQALPEGK